MARERMTAIVGARISEFKRKMAEVNKTMRKTATNVVVNVEARTDKAQKRLDRIARTISSIQTVTQNMGRGSLIAISPAVIPILAGLIASLAMLGPMLGVAGGSAFALGSSFALAGAGALAFAGVAIPAITKLFEENAKLNKEQKVALKSFEKLKSTYKGIAKELEKPVLKAFTKSMGIATQMLEMAKPTFHAATKAVNSLLDSLKTSLGTPAVKAFFDYMNKEAGPLLETTGKSIGNIFKGFASMMVAFGPLTKSTAQGFLDMTTRFAEWADGLSKSKRFQSFVTYVQENMPKIRAIFRDGVAGMVYFFSAFGPLAADMMTGLANLMARFKEWSSTLSENTAFQNFIAYIRENGPAMLTFIGEIARLITNLAVALAPLGAKILEMTTSFLGWFNTLMENHPIVGKIIGGIIVLGGILQAIVPAIVVASSFFSGFGGLLMKIFPALGTVFSTLKLNLIVGLKMIGKQALKQGARVAAGLVIAMGPVGWITAAVIALVALIIWKWQEIKSWTIKTWDKIWSKIEEIWKLIVKVVAKKVAELYSKVKEKFDSVVSFITGLGSTFYKAGKGLIEQMIKGITGMASKVMSAVSNIASKVRDFLPFSPAKVGPLKDIGRLNFGGPIASSIMKAKSVIQSAMGNALAMPELNPALSVAGSEQPVSPSAPSRYDTYRDNKNKPESPDSTINVYNEWDGEKVVSYVERGNAKRQRITDGFGGK